MADLPPSYFYILKAFSLYRTSRRNLAKYTFDTKEAIVPRVKVVAKPFTGPLPN
jgi:hypothetical protein